MLHAPTSETKTAQSKTPVAPQPERELHPHLLSSVGLYSPSGMSSAASGTSQRHQTLAGMHSTHGNQAVLRMLHSPLQVMRMMPLRPSQGVMLQRKSACGGSSESEGACAECKAKEEGTLQRRAANTHASPVAAQGVPPIVHEVLRSPGQPLDAGTRAFMEPRFGHDFSQVRVHTDAKAAESARAVNALAYTVGDDVVFGTGQYAPGSSEGRRLMAHELTHTIQQSNSTLLPDLLPLSTPTAATERQAEQASDALTGGQPFPLTPYVTAQLARQEADVSVPQIDGGLSDVASMSGTGTSTAASGATPTSLAAPLLGHTTNVTDPRCGSRTESPSGALLSELHFDRNSATIRPLENFVIPDFLEFMAPVSTIINVDGYASAEGTKVHNQRLSCDRALAAKAQLVAHGVEAAAINTFAHGATTKFGEGRENYPANRRVIISTSGVPLPLARGHYSVKGLGKRKQAILNNRGKVLDVAVAMLETENMDATPSKSYPYGDGKNNDAANFGIFKQNWRMIRTVEPRFQIYSAIQYTQGAILNTDLKLDIQVLHKSQDYYKNYWFAAHRGGPSGIDRPITKDISNYENAVFWIRDQLNSDPIYLQDDTRFWVEVPPI